MRSVTSQGCVCDHHSYFTLGWVTTLSASLMTTLQEIIGELHSSSGPQYVADILKHFVSSLPLHSFSDTQV